MIKRLLIFLIIAFLLFPLISCGRKNEVKTAAPVKKARPVQPIAPAAAVNAAAPLSSTSEVRGRNPFLSYMVVMKESEGSKRARGPLECCELSLFKLQAVVVGPQNSFALVQAPDGKRYIVRKGDVIGAMGGKITSIGDKSLIVREVVKQDGKVVASNDTELKLPAERMK